MAAGAVDQYQHQESKYRDVLYVRGDPLGPNTVNTMPPATLEAFRDHGKVRASLEEDLETAHDTMEVLAQVGISMQRSLRNC